MTAKDGGTKQNAMKHGKTEKEDGGKTKTKTKDGEKRKRLIMLYIETKKDILAE